MVLAEVGKIGLDLVAGSKPLGFWNLPPLVFKKERIGFFHITRGSLTCEVSVLSRFCGHREGCGHFRFRGRLDENHVADCRWRWKCDYGSSLVLVCDSARFGKGFLYRSGVFVDEEIAHKFQSW